MKSILRFFQRDEGQALVEIAVVLPAFVLTVVTVCGLLFVCVTSYKIHVMGNAIGRELYTSTLYPYGSLGSVPQDAWSLPATSRATAGAWISQGGDSLFFAGRIVRVNYSVTPWRSGLMGKRQFIGYYNYFIPNLGTVVVP